MKTLPVFLTLLVLIACEPRHETYLKRYTQIGPARGINVEELAEGGYIVTGNTVGDSTRSDDLLLLRTDAGGHIHWQMRYGGAGTDNGWATRQLDDGGLITTGFSNSFGAGDMDVYLIRSNSFGDTLWTRTFGGTGDEFGWDIQLSEDGGFIIAAQMGIPETEDIDALLLKIDSGGNVEWSQSYGGGEIDRIFSVQQCADGGYAAVGITYSYGAGDRDAYFIRVDASGELLWTQTFGGSAYDVGHSVASTDDGGFFITGYGESFATKGRRDVYLIKTSATGEQEWLSVLGGVENDRALNGQQTTDGGYVAAGFSQQSHLSGWDWDTYLIRADADGGVIWTASFGDRAHHDIGYGITPGRDGCFVVTGHSQRLSDGLMYLTLLKADADGQVLGR